MRIFILAALLASVSCTKKESNAPSDPVAEGRRLYGTHCTACHAADPKKEGAIGPAIWGSSAELLERRLVYGDYPPGYKSKRETKVMTRLPFLKDQIPALQAYLNSP